MGSGAKRISSPVLTGNNKGAFFTVLNVAVILFKNLDDK